MITNCSIKLVIIPILFLSFYTIMNCDLIAQEKKYSESDIPKSVLESFKKSYPNATVTGYEIETEKTGTLYEIESKEGNLKRDIEFSADGSIVEIGEFIDANTLPEKVLNSIKTKFNSAEILESEKKTRGSDITYEVVVQIKNMKREILLNQNGDIIKDADDDNDNDDKD